MEQMELEIFDRGIEKGKRLARRIRHISRYYRPEVQSDEDTDIYLLKRDKRIWQSIEQ
ncbi:TPA: hypothetical protein HA281_06575 [Candidatus Woesearchaeota archaeon]|nr:hypothetical protein [Candidatus Woesearchaeota archaeon]HII66053.1 hypothetical protein [Candidatus Woesearchaeota archaeon]HIJ19149.1 hypothetical protein [Candidatus Woesearchaeota archaeon]